MRCKACNTEETACATCGAKLTYRNEKRTDVNIATHLVRDACCGACDVAIFVGGEQALIKASARRRIHDPRIYQTNQNVYDVFSYSSGRHFRMRGHGSIAHLSHKWSVLKYVSRSVGPRQTMHFAV
jgi:hypothetical protein